MKKIVLGMLLASSSLTVMAADNEPSTNWVGGIRYSNLSEGEDGLDISLGGIVGSLGYKIESGNNFYLIPEINIGTGISDDNVTVRDVTVRDVSVDVELDSFLALSLRAQFELESGMYLFVAPAYGNFEFKISLGGASATDDSWEFGIGGGAGYKFSKTTSAEIIYERWDETDVFTLGIRFNF